MRILVLALSFYCTSLFAAAVTSEEAANLFKQRDSTPAGIKATDDSIDAYENLLGSLKGEALAEAVDRLGRLAFYRGEMLGKNSPSNQTAGTQLTTPERAKIFNRCRTHASKIKLDVNGNLLDVADLDFSKISDDYRTPFTFWYYLCTALWFKDANAGPTELKVLRNFFNAVVDDKSLKIKDIAVNANYLAGGLQRALAGSFANGMSIWVNPGLPNQIKALELIDLAIKSPSADDMSGMTDPVTGDSYFSNYRVKIDILMNSEKKTEAKDLAQTTIAKIENLIAKKELPVGHEAETRQDLVLLKDQVSKFNLK